jgi:general secretion pathway protein J
LQRIAYRWSNGALIRQSWSAPDAGPGTVLSEQQLLDGLQDVSIRYGGEQGWRPDWIVAATSADAPLPDKVELTLSFGDEDVLVAVFRMGLRE